MVLWNALKPTGAGSSVAKHTIRCSWALDGPDKLELEETIAPIVGYAVLRQDRVVELFAAPNHPTAAQQLLRVPVATPLSMTARSSSFTRRPITNCIKY